VPAIDIHTVGAGGGTIAGVDGAGMLFVGPRGAGANPGPACYGRGGEQPTVTDAQVVLGKMGDDDDAAGDTGDSTKTLSLDRGLALDALRNRVATPLGIDPQLAANGITRLLEQNLLHAVERISIERGYDPSRFVLVAAGGAGPMFGANVGRLLGCRQVYVPRLAGVFCALGMLHSDVRQEFFRVVFGNLMSTDEGVLERAYAELSEQAAAWLGTEGFDASRSLLVREIDLRYRAQQWSIRVTIPEVSASNGTGDAIDHQRIRAAFEQEHQRLFGHTQPDGNIELTAVRVIAVGKLDALEHPSIAMSDRTATAGSRRDLITHDGQTVSAGVYLGSTLEPGMSLPGPALIEEATTTIYVGPHDRLYVDEANNYVIELERSA
jgi:N-methylhydantoinase A